MHFLLAFCYFCCLFSVRIAVFGAGADGVAGAVFRNIEQSVNNAKTMELLDHE